MERQNEYEEVIGEEQEYESHQEYSEEYSEEPEPEDSEIVEEDDGDVEPIAYSHEREDEEDEDYEESPKKKGRPTGNARIQQIQREKYQALNELQRVAQENEQLRKIALESNSKVQELSDAAMYHYDKRASLKLEHAKSKKFKAHEEGDVQAEIEADVEIANAATELQQISSWKAQQENNLKRQYQEEQYQLQQQQNQQNQPMGQTPDPQISYDWVARNTWFNPESHDFDPELAQAARNYSETVENYYYRNGRPDLIMSNEYYQEIDNHIHSIKSQRGQGMSRKQLTMRPTRGGAAPVRNYPSQSSRSKEKHILSIDEREVARMMGIKEKDYLSQKIKDMNERPEVWDSRSSRYGKK